MSIKSKNHLLLFLAFLALGSALQFSHALDWVDRKILDQQFELFRQYRPQPLNNDVVIVGIDEKTFATFKEPFALWHPHLGKFLRAMALARPSALGLDIVLPKHSYHFLLPQYDQSLLLGLIAIKPAAPVFLAQNMDPEGNLNQIFAPYISIAGKNSLASVMVCLDDDGIARRLDPSSCPQLAQFPTMSGKMASQIGVQRENTGLIDFAVGASFDYVPFVEVLDWLDQNNEQQLAALFRDKPVLLGVILPYEDRLTMPVALLRDEPATRAVPGVLLHAQALRSLMAQGMIHPVPQYYLFLLAGCAALFWFGGNGFKKGSAFTMFPLVMLSVSFWLLGKNLYFPVSSIIGSGALAFASRLSLDTILQIREKRFIRDAFSSYVSPHILQEIVAGRLSQNLGGTRRKVCVLFSDIRNFTTRSEGLSPEALIGLLNEYFSEMTQAIHNHEGTVDKFIGDGMMAFFGAPNDLDCPEINAIRAAQEMLARLKLVNSSLQSRGIEPITIGIGLHAGEVVIGHVGSATRHEYTAIGDVVNTASRLEGLTKELKYPIICSALVAKVVGYTHELTDLGDHAVKGHSAVHVYGCNPDI